MDDVKNVGIRVQPNDSILIAPCGLNCSLCRAYVRDRKPCPGCRMDDRYKSNMCITCAIKNCTELEAGDQQFCFSCARFPCATLLHLDRRYRENYGLSAIANLERIKAVGVEAFAAEEQVKWSCRECGAPLCMHKPQCLNCGSQWRGAQ